MSTNTIVAARLDEFADLLEAKDVEFKPRAYRRAAEQVRDYPRPIEAVAAEGTDALTEIEGVGNAIAEKILEYLERGSIEELDELRDELPVDMDALTRVEGLGPKRVGALYRALNIRDLDDLARAAEAGRIQTVDGFGAKTEANIVERIPFARQAAERHLLSVARPIADDMLTRLGAIDAVIDSEVAGSIRRWLPTIGDVDILVATDRPKTVVDAIESFEFVAGVIEAGERKASIRTTEDVRVDFRFVERSSFGAALQYFTGSKDHNVQIRQRAIDRGWKVNEYGVFEGERRLAGSTEAEVYDALDLPWIPPEMREARGEVELAEADRLPALLEEGDIQGDLHMHSTWSDGGVTIAEMVAAAEATGYAYLAITDHATGPGVVADTGVPDDALLEQAADIDAARADADIEIFHGVEANISPDGDISVRDDVLDALDIVIASPHAALGQDRETATNRLLSAIEHPHVDIIGHPTGRKLGRRPGLPIDMERIAEAAAEAGVALEVNSHPIRLDLAGEAVHTAIEHDVSIVISTDAHVPQELDLMRYGVHTARRGWATAANVLNTGDAEAVRSFVA